MARAQVIATYEPNDLGWLKIANSNMVLRPCLDTASRAMTYAKIISPVDSGAYQDAFRVKPTVVTITSKGPRAAAELSNDDPAAAPIEFGNKHRKKPERVMARTRAHLTNTQVPALNKAARKRIR